MIVDRVFAVLSVFNVVVMMEVQLQAVGVKKSVAVVSIEQ